MNFHKASSCQEQPTPLKLNRMSACKVSLLSSGASWVELHPAALPSLHCTVLQTVLIHQILQHITSISSGHIGISICLCLALFATEFTKVLFWALAWAINYRTAIRLKVALSTLIFENLLSFKTLTHISAGEVSRTRRSFHLKRWPCFCECVGCAYWMEYPPPFRYSHVNKSPVE